MGSDFGVLVERYGDRSYLATVPALPGCTASGGNEAEARAAIRREIEVYVRRRRERGEPVPPPGHCCEMMAYNANYRCAQHPDPAGCPDNLVSHDPASGAYGLFVRDGEGCSASSSVRIAYCPWCGASLGSEDGV